MSYWHRYGSDHTLLPKHRWSAFVLVFLVFYIVVIVPRILVSSTSSRASTRKTEKKRKGGEKKRGRKEKWEIPSNGGQRQSEHTHTIKKNPSWTPVRAQQDEPVRHERIYCSTWKQNSDTWRVIMARNEASSREVNLRFWSSLLAWPSLFTELFGQLSWHTSFGRFLYTRLLTSDLVHMRLSSGQCSHTWAPALCGQIVAEASLLLLDNASSHRSIVAILAITLTNASVNHGFSDDI